MPASDQQGVAPLCHHRQACWARRRYRRRSNGLSFTNIGRPAFGEGRDIHVECRGIPEDIGVAHPAEPFVALRAIRGNADEVGALAPQGIAPQLTDDRIADPQMPGFRQIVMDDDARDVICGGRSGKAGNFDKAEPVIGEMGLIGFAVGVAPEDVEVGRTRRSQIRLIDMAIGREDFAKAQGNFVACAPFGLEFDPAGEILAEIHHIPTCHGRDALGRQAHRAPDWRTDHAFETTRSRRRNAHRRPTRVGFEACSGPAGLFETGVIILARVKFAHRDRCRANRPLLVAGHGLLLAVRIDNFQLCQIAKRRIAERKTACRGQIAAIPAVAHHRTDGICALLHQRRDIMDTIKNAFAEVGEFRRKHVITNLPAVDVEFHEHPARSHRGARTRPFLMPRNFDAEKGALARKWRLCDRQRGGERPGSIVKCERRPVGGLVGRCSRAAIVDADDATIRTISPAPSRRS